MKNYKKTIIITTLVTLLPILLGVILWEKLPDSIATHWGADGQASAGQLTPRFLPLSLSIRLLQVTVAISPPAAKGASKGPVFWVHPIGRSPQANAGFRKLDERGASVAKQEDLLIGRDRGLPGGD